MKKAITVLLAVLVCGLPVLMHAAVPKEITKIDYLYEVVRHLYRWYLDEDDAEKLVGKQDIAFWVREITPRLDAGDKSVFGEIVMPELDVRVSVKKANYAIPEMDMVVENDRFKIINVSRGGLPKESDGYTVVRTSYPAMRDYAHRTRALARFAQGELLTRMRVSARKQIREYLLGRERAGLESGVGTYEELLKQQQVVHMAPLSEVANETWVFWETGRMLIRFASDLDLEHPAVWDHDELAVSVYDIDEQTVVSLDEVAGSNAYLTRDQVGRALFNCIVLGRRLVLDPVDIQAEKQ